MKKRYNTSNSKNTRILLNQIRLDAKKNKIGFKRKEIHGTIFDAKLPVRRIDIDLRELSYYVRKIIKVTRGQICADQIDLVLNLKGDLIQRCLPIQYGRNYIGPWSVKS